MQINSKFYLLLAMEWPSGLYTLVKPQSGCPSGFVEGWRYQNNEEDVNCNRMSYGHHFYGILS